MANKFIRAAIVCLALTGGISTGIYTAASHMMKTRNTEYGILTEAETEDSEKELSYGTPEFPPEDTANIRDKFEETDNETEVIHMEDGTKDTKWFRKITSIDNTPFYLSDDGVNWTQDMEHKGTLCEEYRYYSFQDAIEDTGLPCILTSDFIKQAKLKEHAAYREYYPGQESTLEMKELAADYLMEGGGSFLISLQWDHTALGEDSSSFIIGGITPAQDEGTYTAKDGTTYHFTTHEENNSTRTVAVFSHGPYTLAGVFRDMTENDIRNVLDHMNGKALLQ